MSTWDFRRLAYWNTGAADHEGEVGIFGIKCGLAGRDAVVSNVVAVIRREDYVRSVQDTFLFEFVDHILYYLVNALQSTDALAETMVSVRLDRLVHQGKRSKPAPFLVLDLVGRIPIGYSWRRRILEVVCMTGERNALLLLIFHVRGRWSNG